MPGGITGLPQAHTESRRVVGAQNNTCSILIQVALTRFTTHATSIPGSGSFVRTMEITRCRTWHKSRLRLFRGSLPQAMDFYGHDGQGGLLHASRITKTSGDYIGKTISNNERQTRARMLSLPV